MALLDHKKPVFNKKEKNTESKGDQSITAKTRERRLVVLFGIFMIAFVIVAARLGYIQIVKADDYTARAVSKQTRSIPVTSERGTIFDVNRKALAMNESGYIVSASPEVIREEEKSHKGYTKKMSKRLAAVLTNQTKNQIYSKLTGSGRYVTIEKFVDKPTYKILKEMVDNGQATGLQLNKTMRRYYPLGEFASHVLGITNAQNVGVFGIEQYYDQYLAGKAGRIVSSTDASGRTLNGGIRKYYPGTEGMNVVLTLDEVVQHYVEKALKGVQQDTQADRVMAIAMNPKTGAILGMANYPDYDLNDPRTPIDEEEKRKLEEMSDNEKVNYWSGTMWRNPMVSDTYEPGSPFKLLTTSMALEENLTNVSDTFVCHGSITVAGQPLNCWRYYQPHGTETLAQGVANSCNPVFVTLAQRLGIESFYTYLERYGFDTRTGVDLPGETSAIIQNQKSIGPVELATMSYGHGIAVTPIQLITALCSVGNDGKMMKPRLVDKLIDSDGNTVKEFKPEVIRQVISTSTSNDVSRMMEGVVRNGTGSAAYIPGYRIGGKTGTAQKVVNGKYTDFTYSSFFAMAPMDNPQFAVLFIVDSPKGVHYGSQTAGPGVHSIMSNCLKYLNVTPVYTGSEAANATSTVAVPDVTEMSYSSARKKLKELQLDAIACPAGTEDFRVVKQYPEKETQVSPGDSVCLYAYE